MGIRIFSQQTLNDYLQSVGSNSGAVYESGLTLGSNDTFTSGACEWNLSEERWDISLTPFQFSLWFVFDKKTGVPKAPPKEELWQIGYVTNTVYEYFSVSYASEKRLVFCPNDPAIDSVDDAAIPYYARGDLGRRVASYSFKYSKDGGEIVTPEVVARALVTGKLSPIGGAPPPLQLWLEDNPGMGVPDRNENGHALLDVQRVLTVKAWVMACPVGGNVPREGWLYESAEYCSAFRLQIPAKRDVFTLEPFSAMNSFGFAAPANFRPTVVDPSKFSRLQSKAKAVSWRPLDKKRSLQLPVLTGPTANDRARSWVSENL